MLENKPRRYKTSLDYMENLKVNNLPKYLAIKERQRTYSKKRYLKWKANRPPIVPKPPKPKRKLTFKILLEQHLKKEARSIVYRALRNKTLVKYPCTLCGEVKSEAHHEDYLKPLEVVWLCKRHHVEADASRKKKLYTAKV